MCEWHAVACVWRSEDNWSLLCLHLFWFPGIELRSCVCMASTSSIEPSHQSTEFGFGFEIESSFLVLSSYKLECSLLGLLSVEITGVSYHAHQQNIFIVINETLVFFHMDSLCSLGCSKTLCRPGCHQTHRIQLPLLGLKACVITSGIIWVLFCPQSVHFKSYRSFSLFYILANNASEFFMFCILISVWCVQAF